VRINSPIAPNLFSKHKLNYLIGLSELLKAQPNCLSSHNRAITRLICKYFNEVAKDRLSALTQREAPLREARANLSGDTRTEKIICLSAIHQYYLM
jgi:hypothetical protein